MYFLSDLGINIKLNKIYNNGIRISILFFFPR